MVLDRLNDYRPAYVAGEFLEKGDKTAAGNTLELLVQNLQLGEDGKLVTKMVRESDEGNESLAGLFAGEYQKDMNGSKVSELFQFYSDDFRSLPAELYSVAEGTYSVYGDEIYGEILDKVEDAKKIITGKINRAVSDEDKEEAKAVLKKYQAITFFQRIEALKRDDIARPLSGSSLGTDMKDFFSSE